MLLLGAALCLGGTAVAQPFATETGFIEVEADVRLFYQRFGTGTPRLFVPARMELIPTLAPLLERHDAVLWDPRGRGLSSRPDDLARYGVDAEIRDAEAVRRHFDVDQVVYLGQSLWGSVAAIYAARHPESVAGAIALGPLPVASSYEDPPAVVPVHDLEDDLALMAAMEADGRDQRDPYTYCVLQWRTAFADSYVDLRHMALLEAANLCQYANEHMARIGQVIFDGMLGGWSWDWSERFVDAADTPVLMVVGEHEWGLDGIRLYQDVLPRIHYVEFADAAHHVWNERNAEVLELIDAFLARD